MEIRTLATSNYEGCPIYIRNLGTIFEYLTVIGGEIYTAHIVVVKKPLQRLFGKDYTTKQLTDVTAYVLKMCEATIDTVLEMKKSK